MSEQLDLENTRIYLNTYGDILCAFTHIGEEVYLSNDSDFGTYFKGKLIGITYVNVNDSTYTRYPFIGRTVGNSGLEISGNYMYFILEKDTKFKEKKLRPYGINEFFDKFTMLSRITFREKGNNDCIITCIVNGYRTRPVCIDVCLGVEWISLGTLFDKYEYKDKLGNWSPFGVLENEKD